MWEHTVGCNIHHDGRHWASVCSGVGLYVTVATCTEGFNSLYLGFNCWFLVIYQLTFKTEVKTYILRMISDSQHTLHTQPEVWIFVSSRPALNSAGGGKKKTGCGSLEETFYINRIQDGDSILVQSVSFQPQISSVRKKIGAQSFSSRRQKHMESVSAVEPTDCRASLCTGSQTL